MSRCIRRSLIGFVPLVVLFGQTATAFADLTALDSDTRLTDTSSDSSSSSEEKSSSQSAFLIPGLLLAGGALFGLGSGGSGGGDAVLTRASADSRSLVIPAINSGSGITDILLPTTPQASLPSVVLANILPAVSTSSVTSVLNGVTNPSVVNPLPDTPPVFVGGSVLPVGNAGQPFISPTDTVSPPVSGSTGNNPVIVPKIGAPTSVPEPTSVLLGSSLLGAGFVWRLRRKKA